MVCSPSSIITLNKPVQPANAPLPILVTLPGIEISAKPVQPANAPLPILVTLPGIEISVKPLQPSNTLSPILVTPLQMITEVALYNKETARLK